MTGAGPGRRRDGFRERGHQVTRLEAFVDAAFAFAVTLLVIASDAIPRDAAELAGALKRIPAFAASFTLIALIWYQHNRWSRRFGLDDARSVLLSLLLVFLVLVYVYPLRALFAGLFGWITRGALPSEFRIDSLSSLRLMFVTYGVAFGSLGLVIVALNAHALSRRDEIGLDEREVEVTRQEVAGWLMAPATGFASVALALLMRDNWPGWALGLPGLAYFGMMFAGPSARRFRSRRRPSA